MASLSPSFLMPLGTAGFCAAKGLQSAHRLPDRRRLLPCYRGRSRNPPGPCCIADGWRDAIFGKSSSDKQLYERFQRASTDYTAVTPVGTTPDRSAAYVCERVSYHGSFHAMPLPLRTAADYALFRSAVSRRKDRAANAHVEPQQAFLPVSDASMFIMRIQELIDCFYKDELKEAGKGLVQTCLRKSAAGKYSCELDLLSDLFCTPLKRVLCTSIEEVEGLYEQAVNICGFLYASQVVVACGEELQTGGVHRIECPSPAFAVALSTAAGRPCHVQRSLFNATTDRVYLDPRDNDYQSIVDKSTENRPSSRDHWERVSAFDKQVTDDKRLELIKIPWECCYEEVLQLSDDSLRVSLRNVGVAVTSTEGQGSLLDKFAELMDEVERRELMIELAARNQMYSLAAELQSGRSERGKLVQQMRDAQKDGDWETAFRLKVETDHMKSLCADFTLDPESYDPDLDQDPWYRPCR